ncbi:hypothetical protein BOVA604_3203 [Bacteroides ovatus]|uniref:toll/interleukin-1 receptor domain-containing protein n=1 Tax=Bacteroides ovatus TaxID=28116 RepID=UPI0020A76ACC|nr:toll/interleukin-1 receptor domain-containing protein [Bacteroides ovatus]CAG9897686.1 hypothetical protein BOVA604_3203 [Bacteroides ovatus]
MTHNFFAFISYRHTDVKIAKRLQFLLESYNLPTMIQKMKPGIPKRFKVFRDNDELTSGVLSDELHHKLDESKYLIVICSPNSAQSKYVGEEIAYFRSKGRESEIIPFIIDGTPHSKDRECFHPQLTLGGLELLGIDVQAENSRFHAIRFHKAFIRLVARMLDVDFGVLWNRRKYFLVKLVTLMIVVLSIIIGLAVTAIHSRPFDLVVQLSQTPSKALPLSADETDSLYLFLNENDLRTVVLKDLDNAVLFPNILGKYKGQNMRIVAKVYGCYVMDTIVSITSKMALPIQRNPETFGHIRYRIVDNETEKPLIGVTFDFGFLKVKTNDEGILNVLIPIDQQQVSYPVKIDYNGISMHLTYSGDSLQASGHTGLNTIYVQY